MNKRSIDQPNQPLLVVSIISIFINVLFLLLINFAANYAPVTVLAALMFFVELILIPLAAWGVFSFKKFYVLIPLAALALSITSFGLIYAAFDNLTL